MSCGSGHTSSSWWFDYYSELSSISSIECLYPTKSSWSFIYGSCCEVKSYFFTTSLKGLLGPLTWFPSSIFLFKFTGGWVSDVFRDFSFEPGRDSNLELVDLFSTASPALPRRVRLLCRELAWWLYLLDALMYALVLMYSRSISLRSSLSLVILPDVGSSDLLLAWLLN